MEKHNINPYDIAELTKRPIEICRKWIIEGVSDAEDMKSEDVGLSEQQATIDGFAAQRGLLDSMRKLRTEIRRFLIGGPTGEGDGPLVQDLSEDLYRAFAVGLSNVVAAGLDLREVFVSFLDIARELHASLRRLGADAELLSIVDSWRNPLSDADVFTCSGRRTAAGLACSQSLVLRAGRVRLCRGGCRSIPSKHGVRGSHRASRIGTARWVERVVPCAHLVLPAGPLVPNRLRLLCARSFRVTGYIHSAPCSILAARCIPAAWPACSTSWDFSPSTKFKRGHNQWARQ